MKTALIGYTGFVGSNILEQKKFSDVYNSKNIDEIHGKKYDILVNAGVTGTKWIANAKPKEDLKRIQNLMAHLSQVKVGRMVHISTFDVYPNTFNVNESTPLSEDMQNNVYGKNRLSMEVFIKDTFPCNTIVRLPGLFGKNLKKNFIYDFIHKHKLYLTNSENRVQIYNLKHIWSDILNAVNHNISLINFSVEPNTIKKIVKEVFNVEFSNNNEINLTNYDVQSMHGALYNSSNNYLYSASNVLSELKEFVKNERFVKG